MRVGSKNKQRGFLLNPFRMAPPMGGDAYFDKVSLLLHGNGADNSTIFTDSSLAPKTVTANGNSRITTTQSKFGGSCMFFDGLSASNAVVSSHADLEPGSVDFTVEFWMYANAIPSIAGFIICRPNAYGYANFSLSYRPTQKIEAYFSLADSAAFPPLIMSVTSVALNTWVHIAFVKIGLVHKLYINGVLDITVTAASNPPIGLSTQTLIGSDYANGFNGYIDDLRVTKGVARYIAGFTPPILEFPNS